MNWIESVFAWIAKQLSIEEMSLLVIGWLKGLAKATSNKIDDTAVGVAEAVLLWAIKKIDLKEMLRRVVGLLKDYANSTDNKIDDKALELIEVVLTSKKLI